MNCSAGPLKKDLPGQYWPHRLGQGCRRPDISIQTGRKRTRLAPKKAHDYSREFDQLLVTQSRPLDSAAGCPLFVADWCAEWSILGALSTDCVGAENRTAASGCESSRTDSRYRHRGNLTLAGDRSWLIKIGQASSAMSRRSREELPTGRSGASPASEVCSSTLRA